jgi:hypothetical protein
MKNENEKELANSQLNEVKKSLEDKNKELQNIYMNKYGDSYPIF